MSILIDILSTILVTFLVLFILDLICGEGRK